MTDSLYVTAETTFEELKRYVRFGPDDEERLRSFAPRVKPHLTTVADAFYKRLAEHQRALAVLGPDKAERHQKSLRDWMQVLFEGPWDESYYARRLHIGRMHVQVSLPQSYILAGMHVLRAELNELAIREAGDAGLLRASLDKILDIELAIMLESYREAYVASVQHAERLERSELERRLALSEARYGEIVEKAEALITTFGEDGCVLLFNAKCERLTGLSRAQANGLRWLDLFVPAAEHAAMQARLAQARAGRTVAAYEAVVPVVETGRCRVRWHFTTLPGGAEPALCAIGIDVSNEHELGVRSRRAERMAALGTMAAGLAHEIRNPLNSAHLQLTLADRRLSRSVADVSDAKGAVNLADTELRRLAALVEDFLQFARPQPLRLVSVEVAQLLEWTVQLLRPEAQDRGVELALQPSAAGLMIEVDEDKIKQVLLNLVRNALDATAAGGRIELSSTARADAVELKVRDNGSGMDSELPIFEPFFTTKQHGTGLGLAIVHRIVMDHGGEIAVRSAPGDTVFTVLLPHAAKG